MPICVKFLMRLLGGIVITIIVDSIWFSYTMERFYRPYLQAFLSPSYEQTRGYFLWAILAWSTMTIGNYFFVLSQGEENIFQTFLWGMLYGAIIYFIYNSSNKALFNQWSTIVLIVDTTWGALLNGFVGVTLLYLRRLI